MPRMKVWGRVAGAGGTHAPCATSGAGEWSLRREWATLFINERRICVVRTPSRVTADRHSLPVLPTLLTRNVNTERWHTKVATPTIALSNLLPATSHCLISLLALLPCSTLATVIKCSSCFGMHLHNDNVLITYANPYITVLLAMYCDSDYVAFPF